MIAAKRGQTAVIKELLKKGAEPDRQTKGGYRAVDFAQENGQPDAVRVLIEAGSPPPRTIIEIPGSSVTVQETK